MSRYVTLLQQQLEAETRPDFRLHLRNKLAFETEWPESIVLSQGIIEEATLLPQGPVHSAIAGAKANIGFKTLLKGNIDEGLLHLKEAEDICLSHSLNEVLAFVKILKANWHWLRGDVNPAMDLVLDGLRTLEKTPDPYAHAWGHYFLGTFYCDLKQYDTGLKHLYDSLKYFEEAQHDIGLARCCNSLTQAYRSLGQPEKALEYANRALKIYELTETLLGLSRTTHDMGTLLTEAGKLEEGKAMLLQSLEVRRQTNNRPGMITTLTQLGIIARDENDFSRSLVYLEEALAIADQLEAKSKQVLVLKEISALCAAQGHFNKAYVYLQRASETERLQLQQDTDARVRNLEDRLHAEAHHREAELERESRTRLERAYAEIEEKSKSITDSIRYAKTIQDAILPGPSAFAGCFANYFILYKPRDIVSGDFYWASRKGCITRIAAVDCTGHGVPGALMSMLGYSLLNQVVDEVPMEQPGLVLDHLRQGIVQNLRQENPSGSRDSMDVAFLNIDMETRKCWFAGANRPLLIIRKNGEFVELKGDKFPAGVHPSFSTHDFAHHALQFEEGDTIYIFTDGFQDQFGGPKGKKFKYSQFKEKLRSIAQLPMEQQKADLDHTYTTWKGDLEQVDDVTVIGIKF